MAKKAKKVKRAKRARKATKKRPHDTSAIFAKLDEIEAEMKRIGYWSPDSKKPENGNFMSMPFELWLQFVFLPAARNATRRRRWPERSQVGLMALRTYDYFDYVEEALPLVSLLNQFDDLIEHPERFKAHRQRTAPS